MARSRMPIGVVTSGRLKTPPMKKAPAPDQEDERLGGVLDDEDELPAGGSTAWRGAASTPAKYSAAARSQS